MSSGTPDSVRAELNLKVAEADAAVDTAFDNLKAGTTAFTKVAVTTTATAAALLSLTGYSTLSGENDLGTTLVAGGTASFTITGFARATLTDSGGNITNGDYYIPVGTLA